MADESYGSWLFSGVGGSLFTLLVQGVLKYKNYPIIGSRLSYKKSFSLATKLIKHLVKNNYLGIGEPGLIIGIAGGGVMFGDFVSKNLQTKIPIIGLFADLENSPNAPFSGAENLVNKHLIPLLQQFDNYLVIQDIVRTGKTLIDLKQFFDINLPGRKYRVVSLVVCNRANPKPDYSVMEVKNIDFHMPLTINFQNRTLRSLGN